jgi:hypothetical protein
MRRLKTRVAILVLLAFPILLLTCGFSAFAGSTEGVYKVDFSVQTQKWAYPNEDITVQGVTVLEKSEAPAQATGLT